MDGSSEVLELFREHVELILWNDGGDEEGIEVIGERGDAGFFPYTKLVWAGMKGGAKKAHTQRDEDASHMASLVKRLAEL